MLRESQSRAIAHLRVSGLVFVGSPGGFPCRVTWTFGPRGRRPESRAIASWRNGARSTPERKKKAVKKKSLDMVLRSFADRFATYPHCFATSLKALLCRPFRKLRLSFLFPRRNATRCGLVP